MERAKRGADQRAGPVDSEMHSYHSLWGEECENTTESPVVKVQRQTFRDSETLLRGVFWLQVCRHCFGIFEKQYLAGVARYASGSAASDNNLSRLIHRGPPFRKVRGKGGAPDV